jgi:hypothetical protein
MTLNIEKQLAAIPTASGESRTQMRSNAENWLARGTSDQREAAQGMINALNQQEQSEHEVLVRELSGLDTAERVIRAFTVQPITETEAKLVQVLLDNPGSTSTALSQALGWKAQGWHMHFGTMCADRAMYLWPAPNVDRRNGKFYSGILADLKEPENLFTLKPDVEAAFGRLGLRKRA